jgi:hypothetical protein
MKAKKIQFAELDILPILNPDDQPHAVYTIRLCGAEVDVPLGFDAEELISLLWAIMEADS